MERSFVDAMIAKGVVPDFAVRLGIRRLLRARLIEEQSSSIEVKERRRYQLLTELKEAPIAIETDKANDQHYQVPTDFFIKVLGPNLKYSCAHFEKAQSLPQAEIEMLELTVHRAELVDGMKILELGCGWGSLTLYMAKHFPRSQIVAVSNSQTQRQYILARAAERGLSNIQVITANIADLEINGVFDRVVSIEMFEHMRNYRLLMNKISKCLAAEGKLFVHIFVHRDLAYKFEAKNQTDWMSKYFFSGGIMPSEHLLYYFQDDLIIQQHWAVGGQHYAKTARAWLDNMESNRAVITDIFRLHYGQKQALKWWNYWRVFFMSCEELWGFNQGNEWFVGHYLMKKRAN